MSGPLTTAQVAVLRELAQDGTHARRVVNNQRPLFVWIVNGKRRHAQIRALFNLGYVQSDGDNRIISPQGRAALAQLDDAPGAERGR